MVNKSLYHKFMLITKYLMFVVSVVYFITIILSILDNDVFYLLMMIKIPAWIVAYGILLSKVFGYCFAHRLPMYYMLSCNVFYIIRQYLHLSSQLSLWCVCIIFIVYIVTLYHANKHSSCCK